MRLVLCDDHSMFLDALTAALTRLGHDVVASSDDLDDVVDLVMRHRPDVCVLDVTFSGRSGLTVATTIRDDDPGVGLLLLTGAATDEVWSAYDARLVNGVVNKVCDISVLNRAIGRVAADERVVEGFARPVVRRLAERGPSDLTRREQDVLRLLVRGASTERIAVELGVSTNTVRTHVQNVLHKFGVHGRSKAVNVAFDIGLADVGSGSR